MQNCVFYIFYLICFDLISQVPKSANDYDHLHLKGKIKSLTTEIFNATKVDSQIAKGERKYNLHKEFPEFAEENGLIEFSTKGKILLKRTYWDLRGTQDTLTETYTYDEKGNKLSLKEKLTSSDSTKANFYDNKEISWKYSSLMLRKRMKLFEISTNWKPKYSIIKYSARGNLRKNTVYYDGDLYSREITRYRLNGKKRKRIVYIKEFEGCREEVISKYNRSGNIIHEDNRSRNLFYSKKAFKINPNMTKDCHGYLTSEYDKYYKYDSANNMIQEALYKQNGEFFSLISFTYNPQGKVEISYRFYRDSAYCTTWYKYDSLGRQISTWNISHRMPFTDVKTTYSEYGWRKELKEYDWKSKVISETEIKFRKDTMNNEVFYSEMKDGRYKHFKKSGYEYDKKGNWTKRIDYNQVDLPQVIIERNIQYYE